MRALNNALEAFDLDSYLRYNGLKAPLQQAYNDHRVDYENMSEDELKNMLKKAISEGSATLSEHNIMSDSLKEAIKTDTWNKDTVKEYNNLIKSIQDGEITYRRVHEEGGPRPSEVSQVHAGASLLLRASYGAAETKSRNQKEQYEAEAAQGKEQERKIESWAKAEDLWLNDYTDKKGHKAKSLEDLLNSQWTYINQGSEAEIYLYDDNNVLKSINLSHSNDNVAKALDRIALFNHLFPRTAMKVVGFGRDSLGYFRIIITQRFIQGKELTDKEVNNFLNELEVSKEDGTYITSNDVARISDLGNYNILKDKDGNYIVVDADVMYNTPYYRGNVTFDNSLTKGNQNDLSSIIDSMTKDQLISELNHIKQEYADYDLFNSQPQTPKGKSSFTFKDGTTISTPFKPNPQQAEALNVMDDFIHSSRDYVPTTKAELRGETASKLEEEHNIQHVSFEGEYNGLPIISTSNTGDNDTYTVYRMGDDGQIERANKFYDWEDINKVTYSKWSKSKFGIPKAIVDLYNNYDKVGDTRSVTTNKHDTSMTLSGYAGTGKTSLMEILAQKAKKDYVPIMFCATTNKAALVLNSKVEKLGFQAQTLNKLFGIKVEVDSSKAYDAKNLVNNVKEPMLPFGATVIIDEASMINEENYNILTGIAKRKGLKIIYVGDRGQLPPVGEDKVSIVFRNNDGKIMELTQVERTDDNAILKEATNIRNGKPLSNVSAFNDKGEGVAFINPNGEHKDDIENVIKHYVQGLKKNSDYFRILAYTNKVISQYNEHVRKLLGYNDNIPRVGEPIMGYANWGYDWRTKSYDFINAESYKVTKVDNATTKSIKIGGNTVKMTVIPITLEDSLGRKQVFNFMDIKGNAANRETATLLASMKAKLWEKARRANRFQKKDIYAQINAIDSFLFVNDNITDAQGHYLQAKTFDYGYAITVHKSQGSTFTNVLLDENDIEKAKSNNNSQNILSTVDVWEENENNPEDAVLKSSEEVDLGPDIDNGEISKQQNNDNVDMKQRLEYVGVSRATNTVTVVTDRAQKEDSPLNHLKGKEERESPAQQSPANSVSWARYSQNGYEVSTAGDSRFSALKATFKDGTTWNGQDISGRTIEDVYQHVVKKSGKGMPPAKDSILYTDDLNTKEEREDFSYSKGYLPLWQLWAAQHKEEIEDLRQQAKGKVLTDRYASTKVSQARALADILTNGIPQDVRQQAEQDRQDKQAQIDRDIVQQEIEHLNSIDGIKVQLVNGQEEMMAQWKKDSSNSDSDNSAFIGRKARVTPDAIEYEVENVEAIAEREYMNLFNMDYFTTSDGALYGYATKDGRMVLDSSVIKPEHPLHEYTHLWDRVVAKENPELWKRGIELMKQFDDCKLWKQIAENEVYGKKWKEKGLTGTTLDYKIASEVHARLVGENGAKLLDSIAKKKGQKGIL